LCRPEVIHVMQVGTVCGLLRQEVIDPSTIWRCLIRPTGIPEPCKEL
jgi:hypothetical protein